MSAGEVDVRVLGTKFNLKSYAEDSEVEVTLVEGSVEMETKLGGDDRIVRLRPGELVKLDKRTGSTRKPSMCRRIPTAPSSAGAGSSSWTNASTRSSPTSKKRFDVKINVADRALAERRFIASFVNGESLDEMLASFNADEGDAHSPRRPHRQHHQTLTLKRNRPWNKIDPRKKKGGDIRTIPARSSGRELYTPSTEPKPNKCMKKNLKTC